MNLYNREPIDIQDDIPVFSESDEYTSNYVEISNDHLGHLEVHGENPFMSEEYWQSLEVDTIDHLRPHLFENAKILDVGVGLGRLLSRIDMRLDMYGVDISLPYLKEARDKNINVCLSKIEELPYLDDLFDIIVSTDVLEHVLDLNACIEQLLRVLKPGGVMLIRVPNKEDLSAYLTYDKYKYVHLRNFDKASLELFFGKIFNCVVLSTKEIGFIRSNNRLVRGLSKRVDIIAFFENILFHYRQCKLDNESIARFVSIAFDEYSHYNFKIKNRFVLRQFFKLFFKLFNKFFGENFEVEKYYQKVEISLIVRKR